MFDVLVTGASGFIGQALVRQLQTDGQKVLKLDRHNGDVTETATWAKLPKAKSVIHLAGKSFVPSSWNDSGEFLKTNVLGTGKALDFCRQHGANLVLASTYIYGQPQQLPVSESHPVRPNTPYALSKRLAEELCEFASAHQDVSTTILRLFNIYGPGQRREFLIPTILDQIRTGQEIKLKDLSPRRDYVFLNDVVTALQLAASGKAGHAIINIGSGRSYAVAEIVEVMQRVAGTKLPVISENQQRVQEINDVVADITYAKSLLGWEPKWAFVDGIGALLQQDAAA
jgi:GDP-4-dehydro-6-deoxy-D-mannose reductase